MRPFPYPPASEEAAPRNVRHRHGGRSSIGWVIALVLLEVSCRGGSSSVTGAAGTGGVSPNTGGTRGGSGGGTSFASGGAPGQGGDVQAGSGGATSPDASVRDAGRDDSAPGDALPTPGDAAGSNLGGGPIVPSTMHRDIGVHDPSMIWDGHRYYLVATGSASSLRGSSDLLQWTAAGRFLTGTPAWIEPALGRAPDGNTPWAPDLSYFNGKFHIYYCASVFGSNTSVIGVATSASLDPAAPGYGWVDDGLVIQTRAADDYNAIDPSVALDENGVPWLAFGSFWSGIKLRRLDGVTGKLSADDPTLYSLASRNGGAIEAPSIVSHGGYYYLFVSFDACCQGVNSTYRTMAGRATAITGPYVDRTGKAMLQSGGDQLIGSTGRYIGPGGGTAWKNGDSYLYAYHYYDGQANGASKLAVRPIQFTADDWITLGEPDFP